MIIHRLVKHKINPNCINIVNMIVELMDIYTIRIISIFQDNTNDWHIYGQGKNELINIFNDKEQDIKYKRN